MIMEKELNIANILKDKPTGTKLYANAFGELKLECVKVNKVDAIYTKNKTSTLYCFYNDGKYNKNGEPILVPSKKMRDWSKFAWKKGDVLISNDSDILIIFNGFSKDDYTTFEGKHWISVSKKRHISRLDTQNTQNYHIEDNKEVVKTYIKTIEERFGGKLNCETLEIEKTQLEFKDGETKYQFKPFEKVLVRDNSNEAWRAAFFSYINEDKRYVTTSMAWKYCIPYKGNESLLGTDKDVEE